MNVHYSDENVTVYTDDYICNDGHRFEQGIFKVKSPHFRGKTFKGETAWSDAERYINDKLYAAGFRCFVSL